MSGDTERDTAPEPATARAPDALQLELDDLLAALVERAQDVMGARDRLRGLLRANREIAGDLALPHVLRRIIEAARELVHARYAALGVLSPDSGLEQFIHVGVDDATVARIGHLPEGKGLLGALIDDPRPIRLATIIDDPRSVGFPDHHPPMKSFPGVPIRIRDEVYGNLYFTEREGGEFTAEDEELVSALAATAATANEKHLMVEVATGEYARTLTAVTYPIEGTLSGVAIQSGRPVLVGDVRQERNFTVHLSEVMPVGPVMAIPLVGAARIRGALMVGRLHGRRRFNEADLDMATTFANHAAIALELSDARLDQQRMVLLEDRDRIARDLHDHVIQRLFAAGLTVQSVASGLGDDRRGERLAQVVGDIDATIRQIRTSIFELRGSLGPETGTLRTQLVDVAGELTETLGFSPRLRFTGPLDAVVPEPIVEDLLAVVREALTNVVRHSQASQVDVEVAATSTQLTVDVIDNGVGIGEAARRSGLANLRDRAERHEGELTTPDHEGTHLRWTIPLN